MTTIRPFDARDLDALYAISLATGHAGADASHLYEDPTVMGRIYAAPYAVLEPDLSLVLEDQDGVAGFAVGTVDTVAWEGRLEREWWPSLRRQYADPVGNPPASWSADQRRAFMIHHPTPTPRSVTERFPAHLHMNLLPRVQRRGMGSRLFAAWLDVAAGRGADRLHVGVNRANAGAIRFWQKKNFEELSIEGVPAERTLWMGRAAEERPHPSTSSG